VLDGRSPFERPSAARLAAQRTRTKELGAVPVAALAALLVCRALQGV
jgi:hypothetical protein